ncbi:MAG TPA: polysaccharide biosynthesis/export family protein [Bryobacteraceae bacterium]|nr:polysaccharide biosynthesis/export family protein [Bryobacteraceae bacterium]
MLSVLRNSITTYSLIVLGAFVGAGSLTVGSAGQTNVTQAPAQTTPSTAGNPAPHGATGGVVPTVPKADAKYVLQVGDEISIKVFRNPELDDTVKIGPDERISTMLFNDVRVAGMTVDQLRAELTQTYAKIIRDPQVSVIVRNFANLKVFVGGEVERPGLMPISGKMTVLTAVLQAGGFKPTARTENVILVRNNGLDQPVVMALNVKSMAKGAVRDIDLQSFDVVYVPMSKIARLDRFVDQYIRQAIPVNLSAGFTYLLSPGSSVIRFQ